MIRTALVWGCFVAAVLRGGDADFTVSTSSVGHVPLETEIVAKKAVGVLFRRIGITVRFADQVAEDRRDIVVLQIWERAPRDAEAYVLGSSTVAGSMREVNVYCDRLPILLEHANPRQAGVMLGYAIAHELGHVLEVRAGHSTDGIMKTGWDGTDAEAMLRGRVSFNSVDAQRILHGLAVWRWTARSRGAAARATPPGL